jgi:murein DD-endopeptidase MepM/ murein hydrolase activator NlpD
LQDERSRFRKVRVSRAFVWVVSALALAVGLAGLHAPHLLFEMRSRSAEIARLEQENDRLHAEKARFESVLTSVAGQLDSFENEARRIALELGVEPLPPSSGGPAGGAVEEPELQYWFDEELDALASRADRLDASFGSIGEAFRERMQQIDATPSAMPVAGWFSHGYGWRRDPITGEREFHHGVDIVAPSGTDVRAPADGLIVSTGRSPGYGKTIDVSHGHGYVTRYGHLSRIDVLPGDRVRRGDLLGGVGSTGRSTGPHLHYEVFRDGRRVNPWPFLGLQ